MVLAVPAAPIYAHPVPFSYLDLRLGQSQGQLEGYLVAHVTYLARELNVTPAESLLDPVTLESKKEAILSVLRPGILLAADGQALVTTAYNTIDPARRREAPSGSVIFLSAHARSMPISASSPCTTSR